RLCLDHHPVARGFCTAAQGQAAGAGARGMSLEAAAPRSAKPPLAVDLDGTLIRTDVFFESILAFLAAEPWRVGELLWWLRKGRAYAKARLAEIVPVSPGELPYDQRVLAWLREESAAGRTIALATASDEKAARA